MEGRSQDEHHRLVFSLVGKEKVRWRAEGRGTLGPWGHQCAESLPMAGTSMRFLFPCAAQHAPAAGETTSMPAVRISPAAGNQPPWSKRSAGA